MKLGIRNSAKSGWPANAKTTAPKKLFSFTPPKKSPAFAPKRVGMKRNRTVNVMAIPEMKWGVLPDDIKSDRQFTRLTSSPESGYHLSFTAASLRPELARIVAECFLTVGDWALVKERILSTNALQCRSASSAVRLESELRQRLETLTHEQLILLAQATVEDRTAMAWLATCKRIRFAFEFASEVLRDKLAAHDAVLRPSDYESYVENKCLPYPELGRLKPSTKHKIRQVLLKMLTEAGLLANGSALTIHRPALSPAVVRVITADSPHWLAAFLVPDLDISYCRPS